MTETAEELRRRHEAAEEADLRNARQTPSQYANRAFIRTYGGLTRITFGERIFFGDPTIWGAAFTLPTSEAVEIAKLIIEQAEYAAAQQASFDELMSDWEDEPVADEPGDA